MRSQDILSVFYIFRTALQVSLSLNLIFFVFKRLLVGESSDDVQLFDSPFTPAKGSYLKVATEKM